MDLLIYNQILWGWPCYMEVHPWCSYHPPVPLEREINRLLEQSTQYSPLQTSKMIPLLPQWDHRCDLWPVAWREVWVTRHCTHLHTHVQWRFTRHALCTQVRQGLCLVVFTVHSRCDWGQQPPPNTHPPSFLAPFSLSHLWLHPSSLVTGECTRAWTERHAHNNNKTTVTRDNRQTKV